MLIHPHRGRASWAFLTLTLKTESSSRRKRRCGIFLWWVVRRGGGSRWFGLWERAAGWGLCCDSGCDLWAWEAGQSEESLPNQPSWPLTINLEREHRLLLQTPAEADVWAFTWNSATEPRWAERPRGCSECFFLFPIITHRLTVMLCSLTEERDHLDSSWNKKPTTLWRWHVCTKVCLLS